MPVTTPDVAYSAIRILRATPPSPSVTGKVQFVQRRRNRSGIISFPIFDILSRSGDIRDQIRRLYKIDRNFACFGPCDSWSVGLFDVSCFMRGCSVFLYTFCVYSRKLVHVQ